MFFIIFSILLNFPSFFPFPSSSLKSSKIPRNGKFSLKVEILRVRIISFTTVVSSSTAERICGGVSAALPAGTTQDRAEVDYSPTSGTPFLRGHAKWKVAV